MDDEQIKHIESEIAERIEIITGIVGLHNDIVQNYSDDIVINERSLDGFIVHGFVFAGLYFEAKRRNGETTYIVWAGPTNEGHPVVSFCTSSSVEDGKVVLFDEDTAWKEVVTDAITQKATIIEGIRERKEASKVKVAQQAERDKKEAELKELAEQWGVKVVERYHPY